MSIPFHASLPEEKDEVKDEEAIHGKEVVHVDSDAMVGGKTPEVGLSEDKEDVVDKKMARIEEEREKRR